MKRLTAALVLVIALMIGLSARADASLTFAQTCRSKTNSATPFYVTLEGSTELTATSSLPAGTYLRKLGSDAVCEANSGMARIVYSPDNQNSTVYGYIQASVIVSATANYTLNSGETVVIPEALLRSKTALDLYLDMEYGETSGDRKTYTDESGNEVEIGNEKAGEDSSGGGHLTQAEWAARMSKASLRNGTYTQTMLKNADGSLDEVTVVWMGVGRSKVRLHGEERIVNTWELEWATEAPAKKVLAVVNAPVQGNVSIREKSSTKAFSMGRITTGEVVRVVSTGKNWTMVDYYGMRGYVLTSALTFYENTEREFRTGCISVKGKTKGTDTVWIRSAPKNNGRHLKEYTQGTPLTIFAMDEKWTEVDVEGWHCYILSEYVTMDPEPEQPQG